MSGGELLQILDGISWRLNLKRVENKCFSSDTATVRHIISYIRFRKIRRILHREMCRFLCRKDAEHTKTRRKHIITKKKNLICADGISTH